MIEYFRKSLISVLEDGAVKDKENYLVLRIRHRSKVYG